MVAVREDSAPRGPTTAPILTWLRLLRLGLVLSGFLGALAHAETTPFDRSDERAAHNSVYLELGGSGFIWSANYDRMFGEHFSLRVGVEGVEFDPLCDCKSFFYVVPVTASCIGLSRCAQARNRARCHHLDRNHRELGLQTGSDDLGYRHIWLSVCAQAQRIHVPCELYACCRDRRHWAWSATTLRFPLGRS